MFRSMAKETKLLIDKVKEYPCLYDSSHEFYKNILKKAEIWNKIAEELNITTDTAKVKWKNLRDCYIRCKKSTKGIQGFDKKYLKWPWCGHMKFLDNTLHILRPKILFIPSDSTFSRAEVPPQIEGAHSNKRQSPSPDYSNISSPDSSQNKKQKTTSPSLKAESMTNLNSNLKEETFDGVDHLLLSYASAMKKFQPRTQAVLKLEIATLFAQTELDELSAQDETSISSSPLHLQHRSSRL